MSENNLDKLPETEKDKEIVPADHFDYINFCKQADFNPEQSVIPCSIAELFPSGQQRPLPQGFQIGDQYFMFCDPTTCGSTKALEVFESHKTSDIELINIIQTLTSSSSTDITFKNDDQKKRTKLFQKFKNKLYPQKNNTSGNESSDSLDELYMKKISLLKKRNDSNIAHIANLNKINENLNNVLDSKNDEIQYLQGNITLLNSSLNKLECSKNNEIRKLKTDYEAVIQENMSLRTEIENRQETAQKLAVAETKIASLSLRIRTLENLEKKLEFKSQQCDALDKELKTLIGSLDPGKEKGTLPENKGIGNSHHQDTSGSDTDDSYFGQSSAIKMKSSIAPLRSTPNPEASNVDSSIVKDMLQVFKEEMSAERAASLATNTQGLKTIQNTMNHIVGTADIQRILSSISTTLTATEIRMANGAGLFKIIQFIKEVEKATKDEEARKSMLWLKADNSVITLLGGDARISPLSWEDIKKKLKGAITESDPIEAVIALSENYWSGHEDPLAYATMLKEKYDLVNSSTKIPRSYQQILKSSLTKRMNQKNKDIWREMFIVNHEDAIHNLCRVWNKKGRSYIFDDPIGNMPFSDRGVHRDSRGKDIYSLEIDSSQTASQKPPYNAKEDTNKQRQRSPPGNDQRNSGPSRSQDARYSRESYRPYYGRNNERFMPRGPRQPWSQKYQERRNETEKWNDWECEKCAEVNQKYYYKCIKCGTEAKQHQLPPESWQCRNPSCNLSRSYWIKDKWCYGCPVPNPAYPNAKQADCPFDPADYHGRPPTGSFRTTTRIIPANQE